MYPRTNYEMTQADLDTLYAAMQPVAVMMIGGTAPRSQQENANAADAAGVLGAGCVPAKYDDVLVPFVSLMRRELHANAGKGDRPGWLSMDANTALLEVYYHLAKLQKAVRNNDGPAIQEYSADVANMALMVLDVCGGLAFVDADGSSIGGVLGTHNEQQEKTHG